MTSPHGYVSPTSRRGTRLSACAEIGGLVAAAVSDRGLVRRANEDAFALVEHPPLLLVSDGVGGSGGGSLASQVVSRVLPEMLRARFSAASSTDPQSVLVLLRDTVVELGAWIRDEAERSGCAAAMAATLVAACPMGASLFLVSIGDSRAYRLRGAELCRLTVDHSVAEVLLGAGELTAAQVVDHPSRRVLSRYLGMPGRVFPDVSVCAPCPGDRLLLCTDGLTEMLDDGEIRDLLARRKRPDVSCRALVEAANEAGGRDNVTVVVADLPAPPRSGSRRASDHPNHQGTARTRGRSAAG